jgi:TolB protein
MTSSGWPICPRFSVHSLAIVALALWSIADTTAQRAPVLPQIKLPHDYYYREMYLPQVTTGPSAVAWSPDGQELAIAMQGSLWRHRLDTTTAEQIAWGPGYAHQPDWSPNGRYIAYAWYERDRIDLRLLELATGRMTTLVSNDAVNVEPRWSPDGNRIAFVSSSYEGRWHIFTIDVNDGRPGTIERITTDHESPLPRYYYSRFDHFISPTWSPDGRELIFVSNAGHVSGTGGFWRMEARAGAVPREIHYEETTWKARPDWSSDGRVVYSSYLGRQWNQLWMMTSEGGDVFPLTYGEFDTTAPRWSPDARRIAYVSNEDGNTSLWTVTVPGGAREPVRIAERHYAERVGVLRISVTDASNGNPLVARVSVLAEDGRAFAPDEALRHADDGFDRNERAFEHAYFHAEAPVEVTVPAGRVVVEVTRGLQFRVAQQTIDVATGGRREITVRLERLADLGADGWRSGDLHVHMNYGGAYRVTPERLAFQAQAEDLDVVESLIVNKEQRIPDVAFFSSSSIDPAKPGKPVIAFGQEFHTSVWGHLGVIGLRDHLLLPTYAGYPNSAAASLYPHNPAVLDMAHAQGALAGYVHPFVTAPDPDDRHVPLTTDLPVSAAIGAVDYLEVVGFSDHRTTADVWYRLLNCGFRIPAGGGTDAMTNFASLRGPVGLARVFVRTGRELTRESWLAGIREGRTFATNGPLLQFSIDGRGPGDVIRLPAGSHRLALKATLRSIVPIDHLEVVTNGAIESLPLGADRASADVERTINVNRSGWYTLRAHSDRATHPILDLYPFATTSPVYVTVDNQPIRSAIDARYFLAWLDRLEEVTRAHDAWNTDAERTAVLESISRARAVYRDQTKR